MRITMTVAAGMLVAACGGGDPSPEPGSEGAPEESAVSSGAGGNAAEAAPVPGEVALSVAASIDGRDYSAEGPGECKHAADAYIYGVPSAMWMVQYHGQGDVRNVSLTVWRPKSGEADQLSLNIGTESGTSSISTVKGGQTEGSAEARLEEEGEGGRFVVDGRDAEGNPLSLEVRCPRFGTVEAVGG